jgi:prevent-host-death family protein
MKTAGVARLKAHLSEFLAAVKAGEEVSVTERGRPIARIVPVHLADQEDQRLAELERMGLLKRPTKPLDDSFWQLVRCKDPDASVRAALATEREEGW